MHDLGLPLVDEIILRFDIDDIILPFIDDARIQGDGTKIGHGTGQAGRLTSSRWPSGGPNDSEGQDARPEGLQAAQRVMTAL